MRSFIVKAENNERRHLLGSVKDIVHFENMWMLQLRQLVQYLHLQLDDNITYLLDYFSYLTILVGWMEIMSIWLDLEKNATQILIFLPHYM